MDLDFTGLAAVLISQSRSVLPSWFPAGKWHGNEFVIGDLSGRPGESLSINSVTGKWSDFAGGQKGGDLTSLYAAAHGISQGEAFKQLSGTVQQNPVPVQQKPQKPDREIIIPVPDDAPGCLCIHRDWGEPSKIWDYRDAQKKLLGYVARYDPPGKKKQIVPWTFTRSGKGKPFWFPIHWTEPRPLYGLDELASWGDAAVMIVEGEKSADAARKIIANQAGYVVVTWPGGSNGWRKADFTVLHKRRKILLWPDADEAGERCMWEIAHMLYAHCPEVKILNTNGQPDGWDAADALEEGWDWERLKQWAKERAVLIDAERQPAPTAIVAAPMPVDTDDQVLAREIMDRPKTIVGRWQGWGLDNANNSSGGIPWSDLQNAVRVLEVDPLIRGKIWYDEFLQRMLTGKPPREWRDVDDIDMTLYFQREIGLKKISTGLVSDAVQQVAFRNIRNCARDWFDSLAWDGEDRIDLFFEEIFGAVRSAYTMAAGRNFWLSMIARIYQPGSQVDNMIVLEGKQGIGKSRALRIIGGDWFTEQHESASNPKAFAEILQGKMLVEISEMDSFNRAEVTRVKAIVTNTQDRYRDSYGRKAEDHKRQCIFVGTTNKDDWNKDETGARRFWPIACTNVDVDQITQYRAQYFAEAVHRYKRGESWWQMPEEETISEQRKRFDSDSWSDPISEFLGLKQDVTVTEILTECLQKKIGDVGRADQMRVAACLRAIGWQGKNERFGRSIRKVWRPMDGDADAS